MDCSAADSLIVNPGLINPFKILPQHNFSFQPSGTFPIFQELVKIGFSIRRDIGERAHEALFFIPFFFFSEKDTSTIIITIIMTLNVLCRAWSHIRRDDIRSPCFLRRNHFSGSVPTSPGQWGEIQMKSYVCFCSTPCSYLCTQITVVTRIAYKE